MRQQNPEDRESSPPSKILGQHRRDIEALDRRILHLVCERLELARQIGDLKQQCGVPLRNFEVEEQVHRRLERACEELGMEGVLGRDLALFLIDKAVEKQATAMDSAYRGDHFRALVIGGKGGMGAWIARFLDNQGHRVTVLDPGPNISPFSEAGSLADAVDTSDLIIVAVPMEATASVLDAIGSLRPNAVVAEMCSLKEHLQPVIRKLRKDGIRLLSFHPMFGPDVRMLSGRKIVFCTDAAQEDLDLVKGLFADTSAELIDMGTEDHDRRMAVVLGLTHFSNLALARALSHSGVTASEMGEVAGVTFEKQLVTTREVTAENPELYFQIQSLNPIKRITADWLVKAVGELRETIVTDNDGAFTEIMSQSRDFLKDEKGANR